MAAAVVLSKRPRPLVVLAGWLGCQPKSLQRYEALYKSLGLDTMIVIASPRAVIHTIFHDGHHHHQQQQQQHYGNGDNDSCHAHMSPPPSSSPWPCASLPGELYNIDDDINNNNNNPQTMQDLAWKVLGDIHVRRPEMFLFHVFSNGGCFLWESMCRILETARRRRRRYRSTDDNPEFRDVCCRLDEPDAERTVMILSRLSLQCRGVVFDSCPAWFGTPPSKLWQAMQSGMVQREQLVALEAEFGSRIFSWDENIRIRNQEYFDYLGSNRPLDVPQLYLYCRNDPLTEYQHVQDLIEKRRRQNMELCPVIMEKIWDQSAHCAHLRHHPEEYRSVLKEFLQLATLQSRL